MNSNFDPLTLILIAAAVIIFWRLRGVLGTRGGFEPPPAEIGNSLPKSDSHALGDSSKSTVDATESTVKVEADQKPVWEGYAPEGSDVAAALETIGRKSKSFNPQTFLSGAALACELILEAYGRGDKPALKPLLAKDVYEAFSTAIDDRTKRGETTRFQFIGMKRHKIEAASLNGNNASITTTFVCEAISVTKGKSGEIIEGDEKAVRDIANSWTFEKDVTAKDPNWKLSAT